MVPDILIYQVSSDFGCDIGRCGVGKGEGIDAD